MHHSQTMRGWGWGDRESISLTPKHGEAEAGVAPPAYMTGHWPSKNYGFRVGSGLGLGQKTCLLILAGGTLHGVLWRKKKGVGRGVLENA